MLGNRSLSSYPASGYIVNGLGTVLRIEENEDREFQEDISGPKLPWHVVSVRGPLKRERTVTMATGKSGGFPAL